MNLLKNLLLKNQRIWKEIQVFRPFTHILHYFAMFLKVVTTVIFYKFIQRHETLAGLIFILK